MPPKRRSTGAQPKSQQATLAFHGASNRVTKPGARASNAKKNLLSAPVKKEQKAESTDVLVVDEEEEEEDLTTGEAAIVQQTAQEQQKEQPTPDEVEARQITPKAIQAYWKAEEERHSIAPRAHQKELSVEEKVLRKFDMSGQYGVSHAMFHFTSKVVMIVIASTY